MIKRGARPADKSSMARKRELDQRARIAEEAARIMCELGVADFRLAKEKAAVSLGLTERRLLPRNTEIEDAVRARQRLFGGSRHAAHLRHLRQTALKAMRLFEAFQPRLVGAVLSGLATEHSGIKLHLFTDTLEDVDLFLGERGMPFDLTDKRLRTGAGDYRFYPVYRFVAGDVRIEATVFSLKEIRQPPKSPIDGGPMRRANVREVEALLEADTDDALF